MDPLVTDGTKGRQTVLTRGPCYDAASFAVAGFRRPLMQMSERRAGGVTIVDLSGKLVSSESGRLKDKVTSLVFQGEKKIILNLGEVSYVDSSGLGELVACHGTATRGGGAVKLANAGQRIQDLLIMTRLLTVFDCHDSEEAAIKSFEDGPAGASA
jgi:anti-sigma B factor antagonist